MLVNVKFNSDQFMYGMFSVLNGGRFNPQKIHKGIYTGVSFNIRNLLDQSWKQDHTDWEWHDAIPNNLPNHGVCDSPAQFLEKYAKLLEEDKEADYVVGLTEVRKIDQSENGGWRWHKWGEYIGTLTPTCEYLYDERIIQAVWCFNICKRHAIIENEPQDIVDFLETLVVRK